MVPLLQVLAAANAASTKLFTQQSVGAWALRPTRKGPIVHVLSYFEEDRFDAFLKTELERPLTGSGVRPVFVCGLVTTGCINLTALSATQRG